MDPVHRTLLLGLTLAIVACVWFAVGRSPQRFRRLVWATTALTLVLVVLGAYVRLSDAGLGCPDWPGCYGQLTPHHAAEEILAAHADEPHGPVSLPKAWKEMVHRYLAGVVGSLILAIAVLAWRNRALLGQSPWLATSLVFVVAFQAVLGAWTVTMLLKPAIVTSHLVGGMTTFALLLLLALRQGTGAPVGATSGIRGFALAGLLLVCLQIILGGWVSTNYAALACPDLPLCRGELIPPMDFGNAFHVVRELGMTASGELLSNEALTAIHWLHRVGAIIVFAAMIALGVRLMRQPALRRLGFAVHAIVTAQFAIGLGNVLFSLPLSLAAAHNAGAALLLGVLVMVNYRLFSTTSVR